MLSTNNDDMTSLKFKAMQLKNNVVKFDKQSDSSKSYDITFSVDDENKSNFLDTDGIVSTKN